jgi:hypothetical protein
MLCILMQGGRECGFLAKDVKAQRGTLRKTPKRFLASLWRGEALSQKLFSQRRRERREKAREHPQTVRKIISRKGRYGAKGTIRET